MTDIALFVPSMNGGGAERVMLILANTLAEKGYCVDLLLAKAKGNFIKDVSNKVRIVDLNSPRVFFAINPLIKYLKKEQPKVILSAMHYVNVVATIAVKLSGIKCRVVISEHSTLSLSLAGSSYKNIILKKLMYFSYRKADGIVAVSSGVAKDLALTLGLDIERIRVIYNPVVTSELLIKKDEELNHFWAKKNLPFILAVGRLTEAKNFPLLINAFSNVVIRQKNIHLVILGVGKLESELKKLAEKLGIEDRVHILGFMENPYSWMKKSELFVLSSSWEGFGNVLVEAMACDTRVISTNCPNGPAEILEGGKWGVLVPTNDPDALAEAIITELTNKSAVNFSEQLLKYKPNNIVDQYLKVLLP